MYLLSVEMSHTEYVSLTCFFCGFQSRLWSSGGTHGQLETLFDLRAFWSFHMIVFVFVFELIHNIYAFYFVNLDFRH